MRKLTLNANAFTNGEVLTKAQLKNVTGGYGGSSSGSPKIDACVGKNVGQACAWSYQGSPQTGWCQSYMARPMHCSDLR